MKLRHYLFTSLLFLLMVFARGSVVWGQAGLRISEFMALNERGLDDEDRDEEDWIEIHNTGIEAIDLGGWYLTDDAENLTQWRFPPKMLLPDAYVVVFASGKDRDDPRGTLHTNFKLRAEGEYLALVQPDGATVQVDFGAVYPPQAADISYGMPGHRVERSLLPPDAPVRALVPQDDRLEPMDSQPGIQRPWTTLSWDDSSWQEGHSGVGYDYPGLIGLDVGTMRQTNETVYVRIPFWVEDPSALFSLTLRMRFEDGMIAYINGQEVARAHAPEPGTETWNSGASANRSDDLAVTPVDFPVPHFDFLRAGVNILAIQGLNYRVSSSDLLVLPELVGEVSTEAGGVAQYFPQSTPGKANNQGIDLLGPIISDADHSPQIVSADEDLWVTARVTPSFDPVAQVSLYYRILFGREVRAPMLDNGNSHDGAAGDGVYGARIPARTLFSGQLVRWAIRAADATGREMRYPAFVDPHNSPQYAGAVVDNPSLTSSLPVLQRFVENPSAANNNSGTRCVLAYEGNLYDNVLINLHGQSSRGFPKKSYDVDFHPGYNFKFAPGKPRADDINLITTYPDKAQMRNILAYTTYRKAGCPNHWVIPIRVQENGGFWGTAHLMENGDEDWLIRMGINADGALYKMYNSFSNASHATSGAEKKTRKFEGNDDLLDLYYGIRLSGEARRQYLYDHVNVAQVVNFLAARVITGDQDCCHKNYYLYRDTGQSDEWQMWPWDVDLSFGRRWIKSKTYWDETLIANTPVFFGSNNGLIQAIYGTPALRQMFLRRLRTLMDTLLKPPGTPMEELFYEPLIDALAIDIAPDAALDAVKWNSHAWGQGSTSPCCPQSLAEAVAELKYFYLPERRRQLYDGLTSGAHEIPLSQPPDVTVSLGDIETGVAQGDPNLAYIQILNPNDYAVDLSGWVLAGGANYTFPGGAVLPAHGDLYLAANRNAFRARPASPTGGQALFILGDYEGQLNAEEDSLSLLTDRGRVVDHVDDVALHRPTPSRNPGR